MTIELMLDLIVHLKVTSGSTLRMLLNIRRSSWWWRRPEVCRPENGNIMGGASGVAGGGNLPPVIYALPQAAPQPSRKNICALSTLEYAATMDGKVTVRCRSVNYM